MYSTEWVATKSIVKGCPVKGIYHVDRKRLGDSFFCFSYGKDCVVGFLVSNNRSNWDQPIPPRHPVPPAQTGCPPAHRTQTRISKWRGKSWTGWSSVEARFRPTCIMFNEIICLLVPRSKTSVRLVRKLPRKVSGTALHCTHGINVQDKKIPQTGWLDEPLPQNDVASSSWKDVWVVLCQLTMIGYY